KLMESARLYSRHAPRTVCRRHALRAVADGTRGVPATSTARGVCLLLRHGPPSHTITVKSPVPQARNRPSGLKNTEVIRSPDARRVIVSWPVDVFHNFTVPRSSHVPARRWPSG